MTERAKTDALLEFARRAPAIPVVTIEDARHSIPLARTLVDAGLPVIEVTLRTASAVDAIAAMTKAVPEAIIGAGTLLAAGQVAEVVEAGARFLVSPGTPLRLAQALAEAPIPAMPGCATVSEALALADLGFEVLKFFPAVPSGGVEWLKAVHGPVPKAKFCPTGGLGPDNAESFSALPNVICVGGAWMAPAAAIAAGDYATIGKMAKAAAALRRR